VIANLPVPISSVFTPEAVLRELKHLPSAPRVLPRLKLLLKDGNSAMHDIVALVRLDPGIAARVLQMANSAYFCQALRCDTVDEAVHRVGYDQIYELVSYAVASQVLIRPLEAYAIEADDLWRRSVTCALAAEAIAQRTGDDAANAYTVGLLHALGMVAIDEWVLHTGRRTKFLMAGHPRDAIESERAQLGFTNAEVGATLLHHWDFPATMVQPVRWQYAPRSSAGHTRMACLLFVAKWVRAAVDVGTDDQLLPVPGMAALEPLGMDPRALDDIVEDVRVRLERVGSVLAAASDSNADVVVDRGAFPGQKWRR
jgi:HD-like signal output (HDOD) protein